MPFCHKCGKKLREESKFCSECGTKKHEEKVAEEPKVVEKVVEKHYVEKPSKGGIGGFIVLLIVLGLIAVAVVAFINSGALDEVAGGSGVPYVDPCERELNQCNHACGEGILNSICKEKCTYQYNKCGS